MDVTTLPTEEEITELRQLMAASWEVGDPDDMESVRFHELTIKYFIPLMDAAKTLRERVELLESVITRAQYFLIPGPDCATKSVGALRILDEAWFSGPAHRTPPVHSVIQRLALAAR